MFVLSWAAAVLLMAAGAAKLSSPAASVPALPGLRLGPRSGRVFVRTAGLVELAVGGVTAAVGGRWPAVALALTYTVLLGVAVRLVRVAPGRDCGCFGARTSPAGWGHVIVDAAGGMVGLLGVISPTRALSRELGHQPAFGLPVAAGALLLAWLAYQVMTALPELERARVGAAAGR